MATRPSRTITLRSERRKVLLVAVALNVLLIVTLSPGILWRRYWRAHHSLGPAPATVNEYESAYMRSRAVTILLMLCGGGQDGVSRYGGQLTDNAKLLMKSAAALARVPLRFMIVSDSRSGHFEEIADTTEDWPEDYRNKVKLQFVTAPPLRPGQTKTGSPHRDCVRELLLDPDLLRQEDALLYLANDVIFMRPPEQLWQAFSLFNPQQEVGLVTHVSSDDGSDDLKVPYSGDSFLESGVLLMNLTRLRSHPGGGGLKTVADSYEQHRTAVRTSGPDELSPVYSIKFPERLFELQCDWNFRGFYCVDEFKDCPAISKVGASIVRAGDGGFQDERGMKFKIFYETWESHKLGAPLVHLYMIIRENLWKVGQLQSTALCDNANGIDTALSKQLQRAVQNDPYLI